MSSFNDYVSSMIAGQGNAGGYVVLWPKEKPSNIFIMDSPDLNKAKEVLRMNKNGIAFSKMVGMVLLIPLGHWIVYSMLILFKQD